MKSNARVISSFPLNTLKPVKPEPQSSSQQIKSAYLKAILSGSRIISVTESSVPVENPDRAAAIRYIKESASTRK